MDNKKPALAGLGGRMKAVAMISLFAASSVAAQAVAVVDVNIRDVLSGPWVDLGSSGAKSYSYQISHAVKYDIPSINADRRNVDIIIRTSTAGPDGSSAEVSLTYGTMPCTKGGALPKRFLIVGRKSFMPDDNGQPGNPSDQTLLVYPTNGEFITIEQDSPLAAAASRVCSNA